MKLSNRNRARLKAEKAKRKAGKPVISKYAAKTKPQRVKEPGNDG